MTELVELRNGAEEVESLVQTISAALRVLMNTRPTALLELVTKCRDNNYVLSDYAEKELMHADLIRSDGYIHDSIKNIVLSAAHGDGPGLHLINPIQEY